ncbi:S4 domain-containing protein, partial [Archaeoglobus sp.]
MRLDKLLVIKGYFSSRQKAKEAIKRGFVIVNGKVVTKPSYDVEFDAEIDVLQD